MASTSPNSTVATLPTDMWTRILRHLSPAHKARIASTSHVLAQACRNSWHEQDYFTCAGQPRKPASLRVAHGFAAPDDAARWLALTQQMHLVHAFAKRVGSRFIANKPVMALMALARENSPMSRRHLAEAWPMYAELLTAASRSQEAARFEQLTADVKNLEAAVRCGDAATILRLTKAEIPLPYDTTAYIAGLTENPQLADLLFDALCDEGLSKKIGHIFVASDLQMREALLASSAFQNRASIRAIFFQAACRNEGPPDTIAEPLTALLTHCSDEQFTDLMQVTGIGDTYCARGVWALTRASRDPQARLLAAILPRWIAAGGDPNKILVRGANHLNAATVALLCERGACLHRALVAFSEKSSMQHAECHTLDALIKHGGRLNREQYEAFVERCKEICSLEPAMRYNIEGALRSFKAYDAIPAPNVRLRSLFGLVSRFL